MMKKHTMVKATLRLVTCVALAATSHATFADARDGTATPQLANEAQDMGAYARTSANAHLGDHADSRVLDAGDPSRAEARRNSQRARREAAIQDYNHQRFLQQVWSAP